MEDVVATVLESVFFRAEREIILAVGRSMNCEFCGINFGDSVIYYEFRGIYYGDGQIQKVTEVWGLGNNY